MVVMFVSSPGKINHVKIGDVQGISRGKLANLTQSDSAEVNFMSSIANENQVTIFGSSEFTSSPYCPYNFLPDTLGIPALGLGHAYHQSFSILCELLAANEFMENSKVVVILSPGWFMTGGTNTGAFIEFVRPNFLSKIWNDQDIQLDYKEYIGEYISTHYSEIDGKSNHMEMFKGLSSLKNGSLVEVYNAKLQNYLKYNYSKRLIQYDIESKNTKRARINVNYSKSYKRLQRTFISSVTSNNIWVYDDYYNSYIINEDGTERVGDAPVANAIDGQEMNDFRMLVKYLKYKNADCSFIFQPLNPYYYPALDSLNKLTDTITNILARNKIPYLNMFVLDRESYEPGTLNDVMHLGDYGWMKINYFLDSLYYEE